MIFYIYFILPVICILFGCVCHQGQICRKEEAEESQLGLKSGPSVIKHCHHHLSLSLAFAFYSLVLSAG